MYQRTLDEAKRSSAPSNWHGTQFSLCGDGVKSTWENLKQWVLNNWKDDDFTTYTPRWYPSKCDHTHPQIPFLRVRLIKGESDLINSESFRSKLKCLIENNLTFRIEPESELKRWRIVIYVSVTINECLLHKIKDEITKTLNRRVHFHTFDPQIDLGTIGELLPFAKEEQELHEIKLNEQFINNVTRWKDERASVVNGYAEGNNRLYMKTWEIPSDIEY